MAEYLYTQFFPRDSIPQHDLDLLSVLKLDRNNPDEENTQRPILHPEEAMKRKRKEIIALSENMRRKKMRYLFSTLESLLPVSTTLKLARHDIIEETGKYIQNLQNKAQELQKKKAQLLMDHNSSAIDVGIEIYDNKIVIIRITASRMPLSLCKICEVVERRGLVIERADVYKGDSIVFLYIHATLIVNAGAHYLQEISHTRPCLKLTLQNIY